MTRTRIILDRFTIEGRYAIFHWDALEAACPFFGPENDEQFRVKTTLADHTGTLNVVLFKAASTMLSLDVQTALDSWTKCDSASHRFEFVALLNKNSEVKMRFVCKGTLATWEKDGQPKQYYDFIVRHVEFMPP